MNLKIGNANYVGIWNIRNERLLTTDPCLDDGPTEESPMSQVFFSTSKLAFRGSQHLSWYGNAGLVPAEFVVDC